MKCIRIDVYKGEFKGITQWDIYQEGHKPILISGKNPFADKVVSIIDIETLDYTVAAKIYYQDGSMQYTENVKTYFYATEAQPNTGQGETPGV